MKSSVASISDGDLPIDHGVSSRIFLFFFTARVILLSSIY